MAGPPLKLTPELINSAKALIMRGNYTAVVCKKLHIGEQTWYRWKKKGEKESSGIFRDFLEAIQEAEAYAEGSALQNIREAGKQTWQAEAWYLERKFPERWGRRHEQLMNRDRSAEEQDLRLEKLRLEINRLKNPGVIDLDNYLGALRAAADDVWANNADEGGDE